MQPGQDLIVTASGSDPGAAGTGDRRGGLCVGSSLRERRLLGRDRSRLPRLRHAPEDSLGFVPDWFRRTVTEAIERRAAAISLTGDPDPGVFADVDQERLGRDQMPYIPETFDLIAKRRREPGPWCPALAPVGPPGCSGCPTRSDSGRPSPPILRLDADDPVQAWREHVARLEERALALNEREFSAVRFMGPGTDLTVGLIPGTGGSAASSRPHGDRWRSSTCPPKRSSRRRIGTASTGTVRMTKPVLMTGGLLVEGLRLAVPKAAGQSRSMRTPMPMRCERNSLRTTVRPASARSRSSTDRLRSDKAGSSSATSCSTRTRPRMWPGATPTKSPSRGCPGTRPSRSGSASTSQTSIRTR